MNSRGNAVAGFLYFFMAMVIVALLMPTVKTFIGYGISNVTNATNASLIILIFTYWPVYFIVFAFIVLIAVVRS